MFLTMHELNELSYLPDAQAMSNVTMKTTSPASSDLFEWWRLRGGPGMDLSFLSEAELFGVQQMGLFFFMLPISREIRIYNCLLVTDALRCVLMPQTYLKK